MLVVGSETTDDRLGLVLGKSSFESEVSRAIGNLVGDVSVGSAKESLFMFRKPFFGGGQNGIEFNSEEGEEVVEVEAELKAELLSRVMWTLVGGPGRDKAAGGPFLRGSWVVGWAIGVNCGDV